MPRYEDRVYVVMGERNVHHAERVEFIRPGCFRAMVATSCFPKGRVVTADKVKLAASVATVTCPVCVDAVAQRTRGEA